MTKASRHNGGRILYSLSSLLSSLSFLVLLLTTPVTDSALRWGRYHDLKLQNRYWIEGYQGVEQLGLSGLTSDGKSLYTVSDVKEISNVFRISIKDGTRASLKVHRVLPEAWVNQYETGHMKRGRIDLEGIVVCDGVFYLADERKRTVLALAEDQNPTLIDLPFDSFHAQENRMNPFSGVSNAGLEAIACDPSRNLLFVFNERMFRMGYSYSLQAGEFLNQFDVPSGYRAPRLDRDYWVFPDFAGADYFEDKLYLLVRNDYAILELDGKNLTVLRRFSFENRSKKLYSSPGIFGMAEGIAIHKGRFFVIFDNNDFERVDAPGKYNAALLEFEIPK
jgi:hypothetical protein